MKKQRTRVLQTLVLKAIKAMHFGLVVALFLLFWLKYAGDGQMGYSAMLCLFYAVFYLLIARIYKAYDLGYSRVLTLVYSQILSEIICGCIIYAAGCLMKMRWMNPLPVAGLIVVQAVASVAWSYIANKIFYIFNAPRRTVVIYRNKSDLRRLNGVRNFEYKFRIEKYIENPGDDHNLLLEQLDGFEAVFVAGINATLRNAIAKYCVENDVFGYFAPHIGDIIISGATHLHAFGTPVLVVNRVQVRVVYMMFKRAFDIVAALAALIVLSPLMAVTALAIKCYDSGPVLYRQTRLTRDGKTFRIVKFRSMRADAEKDGVARLAYVDDDRITPVGRFIRKYRIDELPQLFNILAGDMTIVGPRPERPEIAAKYDKSLPAFRLRLQVKAGLTGYAQVYGRYNTEPYDKLQMDLIYINRMSFVEDMKIILATIKILFMKESTYGVSADQITALRREEEKSA